MIKLYLELAIFVSILILVCYSIYSGHIPLIYALASALLGAIFADLTRKYSGK